MGEGDQKSTSSEQIKAKGLNPMPIVGTRTRLKAPNKEEPCYEQDKQSCSVIMTKEKYHTMIINQQTKTCRKVLHLDRERMIDMGTA